MKTSVLKTFSLCAVLIICATSFAFAATECTIVPSSIPWNESDQGTWITNDYTLTIECTENGSSVQGYQAQFNVNLQEGASWEKTIATLTIYSNPTDSNGKAYINVPLIHVQKNDGNYIHICPFDDIQFNGVLSSQQSQAASVSSSAIASLTASATTGCLNTMPGCCQTTITITCCTPNRVINYCTTTTEGNCPTGTTHPDPCTTITTTWDPNGTCNYCEGICVPGTAIELSSFTAKPGKGSVTLNWTTETEIDNAGFNILRATAEDGDYAKINSALIPATAGATQGASYQFIDNSAKNRKTYYYKLEDVDNKGNTALHGPVSATPRMIFGFLKKN